MPNMIRISTNVLMLLAIQLLISDALAGELAAGREKVQAVCQTCHGMDGQATTAMVPNLSGQQKEYLVIQLQAFRAGNRQHAQMNIIAQMLSDDDIENVAEWYSSIKVLVEVPE